MLWSGTTWISTRLICFLTNHSSIPPNIFLIPKPRGFFSGMIVAWKVSDCHSLACMPLLETLENACGEVVAQAFGVWIHQSRIFSPYCLARENIAWRWGALTRPKWEARCSLISLVCVFRLFKKRATFIFNFCTENPLSYSMFYFFIQNTTVQKYFGNILEILLKFLLLYCICVFLYIFE